MSDANLVQTRPGTAKHASQSLGGIVSKNDIHLPEVRWIRDVGGVH